MAGYYQPFHPAVFRLAGWAAGHFAAAGRPLGVCGEMAGVPAAAAVLVGLGVKRLSIGRQAVPRIKRMLAGLTMKQAQEWAEAVIRLPTAAEAERYLKSRLG
jgi:phosphotransferase system enzyme I (PtsI)